MAKIDYFPLECKEIVDSIALAIKDKRLDARIRQSDLAERVGVSVSTIRKIEAGDRRVELGTMLHVLWQLGILKDVMSLDRDSMQKAVLSSRRVRLPYVQKEDF